VDFRSLLRDALQNIGDEFAPDALAYLALTSKPEFVIRDQLAFHLHRQLADDGLISAREWKRADLALLREHAPAVLLELKAMYTFDALRRNGSPAEYECLVRQDIEKALRLAEPETQVFALLLATHPHGPIADKYAGVVKYLRKWNGELARNREAEVVREQAHAQVSKWFPAAPGIEIGSIPAGEAFGVRVSVEYWLLGPFIRARA